MTMRWTMENDLELVTLLSRGEKVAVIAGMTGRTVHAVSARISALRRAGVDVPDPRSRRQTLRDAKYAAMLNLAIESAASATTNQLTENKP